MPRIARIQAPYCVHHLIVRFVNGQNRFDDLPGARQEFLRRLEVTLKKVDWVFLAFALMGNHGHLVFLSGIDPPSKVMKPLGAGFAGWCNSQMRKRGYPYNQTRGPVFADRFADVIVPPEPTAIVVAYVHNNPVRARLVISPEMSEWTSHRWYLGLNVPLPCLNSSLALKLCGFDDTASGRTDFHDFVLTRLNDPKDESLSSEYALEQRQRIRAALKLPAELATGSSGVQSIEFAITPRSISADNSRYKGSPDIALGTIAEYLGFLPQQIQSRYRSRAFSYARAVLVQTWAAVGRPVTEIASLIGISPQAAYYLARVPVDRNLIQYFVNILLQ